MTLCQTKTLTDSQKNRILSLVSQCCAYDAVSLSYPVSPKENASHFLLYSQKKGQPNLVSALALVPMDDSAMECIAFTHPDWRRRHYFSRLLSSALKSCHDQDLFFPYPAPLQTPRKPWRHWVRNWHTRNIGWRLYFRLPPNPLSLPFMPLIGTPTPLALLLSHGLNLPTAFTPALPAGHFFYQTIPITRLVPFLPLP